MFDHVLSFLLLITTIIATHASVKGAGNETPPPAPLKQTNLQYKFDQGTSDASVEIVHSCNDVSCMSGFDC